MAITPHHLKLEWDLQPLRQLYFELGYALYLRNSYNEAIKALNLAQNETGDAPQKWEIEYLSGLVHQAQRENSLAFEAFLRAVADSPHMAGELLDYAHQLLNRRLAVINADWVKGEWAKLVQRPNLDTDDQAAVAFFLGRAALYTNDYAEAKRYYEQANSLSPDDPRILEGLGIILQRPGSTKNFRLAHKYLQRAYELAEQGVHKERLPAINRRLIYMLILLGKYSAALKRTETSLLSATGSERISLLIAEGQCYLCQGEYPQALAKADELILQDATNNDVHLLRIRALLALHRYKEADLAINDAIQYDPGSLSLTFFKIQTLVEGQRDLRQAEKILVSMIAQNLPKKKEIFLDEIRQQRESPFMAHRLLAPDDNAQTFVEWLDSQLKAEGEWEIIEVMIPKEGGNEPSMIESDISKEEVSIPPEILLAPEDRLDLAKELIDPQNYKSLLEQGDYKAALKSIQAQLITAQGADKVNLLLAKGQCFVCQRKYQQAVDTAQEIISQGITNPFVFVLRIQILLGQHKYPEAEAVIKEALQLHPENLRLIFLQIQNAVEGQMDLTQAESMLTGMQETMQTAILEEMRSQLKSPFLMSRSADERAQYFMQWLQTKLPAEQVQEAVEAEAPKEVRGKDTDVVHEVSANQDRYQESIEGDAQKVLAADRSHIQDTLRKVEE